VSQLPLPESAAPEHLLAVDLPYGGGMVIVCIDHWLTCTPDELRALGRDARRAVVDAYEARAACRGDLDSPERVAAHEHVGACVRVRDLAGAVVAEAFRLRTALTR